MARKRRELTEEEAFERAHLFAVMELAQTGELAAWSRDDPRYRGYVVRLSSIKARTKGKAYDIKGES